MKNRVVSLILAVVMIIASVPVFAISSFAAQVATDVPSAPVSVTYVHTASKSYLADGKIIVELDLSGQPVDEIYMCWLSGDTPLAGYDELPKHQIPAGVSKVTLNMVPNTLVPEGATGLRVYTSNEMGRVNYKDIELPETIQPLSLGEPIISFQAVSDTHVGDNATATASKKVVAMFNDIVALDPSSSGIFIAGDVSDNGVEEQYAMINELHSSIAGLPSMYWCMGNHDFWNGRNYEETERDLTDKEVVELFNQANGIEGDNTYYDIWIEDYHFIFLSYEAGATRPSDEQINWLAEKLAENSEEDKPIFIFLHQSLEYTVAGSAPYDGFATYDPPASLEKILAAYPQAMLFTGHSHCDMNIPDSMLTPTDEHCYLFNCGAVIGASSSKYLDANGNKIKTSQGYYVSVYEDYVVIRGRNFDNGTWIPGAQFIVHYDGSDLHVASELAKAEKREEIASRPQEPQIPEKYNYDDLLVKRGLVAYLDVSDLLAQLGVTEDTTLANNKQIVDAMGNSVPIERIKSGINPVLYTDGSVRGIFKYIKFLEKEQDYTVEVNAKLNVASYDGKILGYFGVFAPYLNAKNSTNYPISFRYNTSYFRDETADYYLAGYYGFATDTGIKSELGFNLSNAVKMTPMPFYYTDDATYQSSWIAATGTDYLGNTVSGGWVGIDEATLTSLGDTVLANPTQMYLKDPVNKVYKTDTSKTYYVEKHLNDEDLLADLGYESIDALTADGYSLYGPGKYDGYAEPKLYINTNEYTSASIRFPYILNHAAETATNFGNDATNVRIGADEEIRIYSYRIYTVALTQAEVKQNNFADMAREFEWDMTIYETLSSDERALVHDALSVYNMFSDEEAATELFTSTCEGFIAEEKPDIQLEVTDGLIASIDFSNVTIGSYAKNSTYTDELENTFTFTSASTVAADGYLNGAIKWANLLPEETDYTVQSTLNINGGTSKTPLGVFGLQQLQFTQSDTNLQIRGENSAWRKYSDTAYANFRFGSPMYSFTNPVFATVGADSVSTVLTATYDVTAKDFYFTKTQPEGVDWYAVNGTEYTLDHSAQTVSSQTISGGFAGLTKDEYAKMVQKPIANEIYWYADGAATTYVKNIPETPTASDGQIKFGAGIYDGYFTSAIYNNGVFVSGTDKTLSYVLSPTGTFANNATDVSIGNDSTYDIYSVRVYNRILSTDEMKQNNFADMAKAFSFDLSLYEKISEKNRKELVNALAEYNVFSDKETVVALYEEKANELLPEEEISLEVTDGLIAYIDFSEVAPGSYAKNSTYTDELGNTFTFTAASTVTADGYLNGNIKWVKILPEEQDYTVAATVRLNNTTASNTVFGYFGLDKVSIASTENADALVVRSDVAGWRMRDQTLYAKFRFEYGMYSYTGARIGDIANGDNETTLVATYDVTAKDFYYTQTQLYGYDWYALNGTEYTLDHEAQTVSTNTISGGFVGLTSYEYSRMKYKPNANEIFWYADGAATTYVKDIPETPTADDGQIKFGGGIYDGYFTSTIYRGGVKVDGASATMPYVLSPTGTYANNGTDVSIGSGTVYDVYSVRIYDRVLSTDEMNQNNFADLVKKFDLDITEYKTLSEVEQWKIIGTMAEYDVFDDADLVKAAYTMALATDAITFDGYQAKIGTKEFGLRALYRLDTTLLEELEALGCKVELGAIMAVYFDGRTQSDMTVTKNESGEYIPDQNYMAARVSYTTGESTRYLFNEEDDPENIKHFVFALIYGTKETVDPANLTMDFMYRVFVDVTTPDGESKTFYFDTLTERDYFKNNDRTSLYEVSSILYENGYAEFENIQAVLDMVDSIKEMHDVYYTTPAIPANAGETIDLSCYNVQLDIGVTTPAEKLSWSSDDLTITGGKFVTPTQKGVYTLKVTDGVTEKNIYIIAKNASDSEYVLFETDFSDFSLDDLTMVTQDSGATIAIEDGVLKLNSTANGNYILVLFPDYIGDFGDYTITSDVKYVNATSTSMWFSLIGRMQEDKESYAHFVLRNDITASNGVELQEVGASLHPTKKYKEAYGSEYRTLVFDMSGHTMTGYIDGNTAITTDAASSYPVGYVGIRVRASELSFDNFKVTVDFDTAAEYKYTAAKAAYTESNISLAPSIIKKVDDAQDLDDILTTLPTSAMMNVNSSLQVVDSESNAICSVADALAKLDHKVIPVFRISDADTASALGSYLASSLYTDVMVAANDGALITQLRNVFPSAKGILEFSDDCTLTTAKMVEAANVCNASVALLPLSMAESEITAFFHARGKTMWHYADADTKVNTFTMITAGTAGIVTNDVQLAKDCLADDMFVDNSLIRPINIVGHRGIPALSQENTITGALLAASLGANIIETDLQLTNDGVIVAMHDSTLDRTTTGTGNVSDYTYEELKQFEVDLYNITNPNNPLPTEPIPTLEDYLVAFKDKPDTILFLEIKSGANNETLINGMAELIQKYDMADQCWVISFAGSAVTDIREEIPGMSGLWLKKLYAGLDYVLKYTSRYNCSYETYLSTLDALGEEGMSASFYRGVPLWVYTANNATLEQYIRNGVFGVTTDQANRVTDYYKFAYAESDSFIATVGEALTIGLVAETYGAKEVTPTNAQMFVIDGGEGLSYNAATDTVTASQAGEYTVVFRLPFMVGSETTYIFSQPIVITAK